MTTPFRLLCALLPLVGVALAQDAPRVVTLWPAQHGCISAGSLDRLRVTLDRAMDTRSFSFCGGGESFPKVKGKPVWLDDRTIELSVELSPGREYQVGLNSLTAKGFRSKEGVPLRTTAWSFATLPAELPDPVVQRKRNEAARERLLVVLDEHYSYRDRLVGDWGQLAAQHAAAMDAAPTDRAWVSAALALLAPTQDLHLGLRWGERAFGSHSVSVDSLFDRATIAAALTIRATKTNAMWAMTSDGYGYLCIGSWGGVDVDEIEGALAQLRPAKGLVIDVRPNAGGDERLAQRIAAWFVEGTKVYAKHRLRTGPGQDGFAPVAERSVTGNADPEKRYSGPIAVLTSRFVMSSCESFVLMLRQAPACTVVGQPTGGSSGNPKPWDLGNDVVAMVPSWQDLRPDGTCFEGEGLAPDVLVTCTPADWQQGDPILRRALQVLAETTAGAKRR